VAVVGNFEGSSDADTVGMVVGLRVVAVVGNTVGFNVVGFVGGCDEMLDGCVVGVGVGGPMTCTVTFLLAVDSRPAIFTAVTMYVDVV